MKIVTVVFGDNIYSRLADVLEHSVRMHCPDAEFIRIECEPHTPIKGGVPNHVPENLHKKQYWSDAVYTHRGEEIVLLDCDTVVLGDLSHVFQREFDLAYTIRPHRIKVNSGVLFCRSTQATRRFFDKWMTRQANFCSEEERPHLHARLRKFAGIDQAAFMHALDEVDFPFRTIELPCQHYNNVDQTWSRFNSETRILHIKGRLRRAVLENRPPEKHPVFADALRAWQSLAAAADAAAAKKGNCHVTTS